MKRPKGTTKRFGDLTPDERKALIEVLAARLKKAERTC